MFGNGSAGASTRSRLDGCGGPRLIGGAVKSAEVSVRCNRPWGAQAERTAAQCGGAVVGWWLIFVVRKLALDCCVQAELYCIGVKCL